MTELQRRMQYPMFKSVAAFAQGDNLPPRFRALAVAFLLHQHETVVEFGNAGPVGIPGMSWGEAMAFERVNVVYPANIFDHRVTWDVRKDESSSDRSKGCVVAIGTAPSATGVVHVAGFLVYLQLQTGIFSFVVNVVADDGGRIIDLFWALRICEQTVCVGPINDDPISSHQRYFSNLRAVATEHLDSTQATGLVPTTALSPVAITRNLSEECVNHHPASEWRAAWKAAIDLMTAVGPSQRGAAAIEAVQGRIRQLCLAPFEAKLLGLPRLYAHEPKFQQLTTPKGVWHCDTGNSTVTAVNVAEAWSYNVARIQKHVVRAWDRGLSALWCAGFVPLGALVSIA